MFYTGALLISIACRRPIDNHWQNREKLHRESNNLNSSFNNNISYMTKTTEFRLVEKRKGTSNWERSTRKGEKVNKLLTLCMHGMEKSKTERVGVKPMGEDLKSHKDTYSFLLMFFEKGNDTCKANSNDPVMRDWRLRSWWYQ